MSQSRSLIALLCAGCLVIVPGVLAQDKPKDDALDRLLEKVEKAKQEAGSKADDKKSDAKAPREIKADDKALDNLLEKLGETKDKPAGDKPQIRPPGRSTPPPPTRKPDDVTADKLKDQEKVLDQRLEELTGRKRKQNQQQQDGANGPLAEAIKKMREVEKRLSQPDTGEETRKRQGEIVKDLDNLIQQIKNAQGQGQGKGQRMSRRVQQAGKPGDQQGQPGSPSNTGSGVGPQKPQKPLTAKAIVGDKNEWGHLPPELREEMMNVFKEQPLPKRERQISRYYESVSKKSLPPKE